MGMGPVASSQKIIKVDVPDLSNVDALLELIKNPGKVAQLKEQVKEYTEACKDAYEKVGKAGEIHKLHESAQADREAAREEKEKAQGEAQHILDAAREEATRLQREAQDLLEEAQEQKEHMDSDLKVRADRLNAKEQDIKNRENKISHRERDCSSREREIEKREQEVNRKLEILKQLQS